MSLFHIKVGDRLYVTDANFKPRLMRVTKVGRDYLYVGQDNTRYSRENGVANSQYSSRLITEDEFELQQKSNAARRALAEAGLSFNYSMRAERVIAAHEALIGWLKGVDQ